ncbi:MAG: large helicase [Candidatus Aenigmarchaeota archaeon ex4484_224]|nr:MAG: large helicase [Candidatus Aenigmarchaeota archaeon ex4484_224]
MIFSLLGKKIQDLISQRFKEPTLVQRLAIPKILEGKNLLIISETGSGKTESAMLPIFSKLIEENYKPISVLYITPLRALNRDLLERLIWWSQKLGIEIDVRHGDTSSYRRRQQAEFPPKILIATLETLQPILVGKKMREHLKNIKFVIVDEVHEVIDSKRGVQLSLALQRLSLISNFQLILLSATVSEEEKVIRAFGLGKKFEIVKALEKREKEIKVIYPSSLPKDKEISEKLLIPLSSASRLRKVLELIEGSQSSLLFTNTREFAEILGSRIKLLARNFKVDVHHSSLGKEARVLTERKFKQKEIKSVICTSSLQLGIDIGHVDLVIQYQSPRKVTQFLQRIGRSGHAISKKIKGIIIATNEDDIFESSIIAKKALNFELEKIKTYEKPLDILAHQTIGLLFDFPNSSIDFVFSFFKKNFFYRNLTKQEFLQVLKFLESIGLIFIENGKLIKRRKAYEYYFSQISTIPSSKKYKMINLLDKKLIANLDEEFVLLNVEKDSNIIVKGEAWRVVDIQEDKVFVEPSNQIEGAIPSWEGELIPVSFEVSQDVCKLRQKIYDLIEKNGKDFVLNFLKKEYPIDENCARKMVEVIEKQEEIPNDKKILIEKEGKIVVINLCFGSKVNETISKILEALISSRYFVKFLIRKDPYRIIIYFENPVDINFKEIFKEIKKENLEVYLDLILPNSKIFEWRFVQVAKRFGLIKEDADLSKSRVRKLIEEFRYTPIFAETLNEIKTEKLDVEKTKKIFEKIKKGEIEIFEKKKLSKISKIGLEQFSDISFFGKEEKELIEIFKKRILETKLTFVCVNCGKWYERYLIKEIPENLKCRICGAKLIAPLKVVNKNIFNLIKKAKRKKLNEKEAKKYNELKEKAEIFMYYGKKGAIALACKGIGPKTAKRILSRYYRSEKEFFKALLEEEKRYILNKKFWKV